MKISGTLDLKKQQQTFSLPISIFHTEINPSLSGQISDETWYSWCLLATTLYQVGHSQNQITTNNINQTYIYFHPCSLICLVSLDPFLPFIPFPILH